ncbi:MAG: TolC family protein [Candidatus Hydrogenedentes bacterium]|nr:TolC family protein [Candidatus Hydrogenedentota bacterium]
MWRIVPLILAALPAFAETPPFEEPQGELTLQRAVDTALLHSPKLAPYAWDLRIGDARIAQARLRPNPELSFEIENIVLGGGAEHSSTTRSGGFTPATVALDPVVNNGAVQLQPTFTRPGLSGGVEHEKQSGADGFANAEFTLSLAHVIELGGKRAARIETAERERAVAEWDYEVARFEVVGEVVARYTEVLAAQARVQEELSVVELSDSFAATVSQLVDAGSVSPLESRRAKAAAEQAHLDRREKENELDRARLRLAATWGSTQPAFGNASGDVAATPALPTRESVQSLRNEHPILKRWGAELARRGAVFRQERSLAVPDLTVRFGYRATSIDEGHSRAFGAGTDGFSASRTTNGGDDLQHSIVLEASLPLPIFHRNQGAIREAELNHEKLGDEQRAWESEVDAALAESFSVAEASLERIDGVSQRILPELEKNYALTQEGYQRGKFAFLDVLDAQRAVVDARLELLDARIAYHQSIADIERLAGAGIVSNVHIPQNNLADESAKNSEN